MNEKNSSFILGYKNKEQPDTSASVSTTPEDLLNHTFLLGQTGSGKSTMIRALAKQIEAYNLSDSIPQKDKLTFVYIDPKGIDSVPFSRQFGKRASEAEYVHYLDVTSNEKKNKFSINPFQISANQYKTAAEKDRLISYRVREMLNLIYSWYAESSQQASFHKLSGAFEIIIRYMYTLGDNPTFYDMYSFIQKIKNGDEEFKKKIFEKIYRADRKPDLRLALASANIKDENYSPILNRLENLSFNPLLKEIFCVRQSTISRADMLKPGHFVIINLNGDHSLNEHLVTIVYNLFASLIWNYQEEATTLLQKSYSGHIILALDEFQSMHNNDLISKMIELGRGQGFGLMFAHQTTVQIKDYEWYQNLLNNTKTYLIGKISEADAEMITDLWGITADNEQKEWCVNTLSNLKPYQWAVWRPEIGGDNDDKDAHGLEQFWSSMPDAD